MHRAQGPKFCAYLVAWGAAWGEEEKEANHTTRALQDKGSLAGELALGRPLRPGVHMTQLSGGSQPHGAPYGSCGLTLYQT